MFFLYIDESGKPSPNDHTLVFSLVGIAFHENSWAKVNEDYLKVKKSFFPHLGIYDEVKAKDIINPLNKDNNRNRRFMHAVLDIALKRNPAIFPVAMYKKEFYDKYRREKGKEFNHSEAYKMCLKRIVLGFNDYLMSERNPPENGILILDSRRFYATDYDLAKKINSFVFETQNKATFRVLEAPFFGVSNLLPNLQIADFLSYIIRGRLTYTNYLKQSPNEANLFQHLDQYWRRITDKFKMLELLPKTP
jgi:hypothetical protein